MSLGAGLSKLRAGKVFRIGHLGSFNDLMLMGTLSGVEMALDLAKVPHQTGGVLAAMEVIQGQQRLAGECGNKECCCIISATAPMMAVTSHPAHRQRIESAHKC